MIYRTIIISEKTGRVKEFIDKLEPVDRKGK